MKYTELINRLVKNKDTLVKIPYLHTLFSELQLPVCMHNNTELLNKVNNECVFKAYWIYETQSMKIKEKYLNAGNIVLFFDNIPICIISKYEMQYAYFWLKREYFMDVYQYIIQIVYDIFDSIPYNFNVLTDETTEDYYKCGYASQVINWGNATYNGNKIKEVINMQEDDRIYADIDTIGKKYINVRDIQFLKNIKPIKKDKHTYKK